MSGKSFNLPKKTTQKQEINHYRSIIDEPSSEIYVKEMAVGRLIQLGAFKHLIEIVDDTWKPVIIREKALNALATNPEGNEDFLFSIVNDWHYLFKFRRIALEGLIKAKSTNHLRKLLDGISTPEWVRKRVNEASSSQ